MSRKQKIGKHVSTPYSHETASLGSGTDKNFSLKERADQMLGFNIKVADSTAYQTGYGATMGINTAGTFIFKNTSSAFLSGAAATLNEVFSISKTGVCTISSLSAGAMATTGDFNMDSHNITNIGTLSGFTAGGIINLNNYRITNASSSLYFNTSYGTDALRVGNTGPDGASENTGFGYKAGELLNDTTQANCFFGSYAGSLVEIGSNNIGIGQAAMSYAGIYGTPSANVGVGNSSLYYISGTANSALGHLAAWNAQACSNTTAVGSRALEDLLNADGNTAIGMSAGTTLTTGANNIFIGHHIAAASSSLAGSITIGNSITSGASNTVTIKAASANAGFFCNALASASTAYKMMFNTSTYEISYTSDTSASVSDGWVDSTSETWTYVSADAPTFVFSVNADVTTKYSAGMKVRYVQSATTKYGIITAVGAYSGGVTNITIYGGGGDGGTYTNATSYTLANAAISSNYYSMVRTPYGFPMSPTTWSYIMINAVDYSTTSATYVNSSASLQTNCPIGVWNVDVSFANLLSHASVVDVWGEHALSTSTSSVSNVELLAHSQGLRTSAGFDMVAHVYLTSCISAASKTTYYLIYRSYSGRTTYYKGTTRSTYVNYKCAYL